MKTTKVAMATTRSHIDLQWENACHQCNAFSFDRILKRTYKWVGDKSLDEFESWGYIPLIAKIPLFDFVISKSRSIFDRIFLKLADKMDIDDTSEEFETWSDRIICLRVSEKKAYI